MAAETQNLKISSESYIGFKLSQLLGFAGTLIAIAFAALSYYYFDGQRYDQEQREKNQTDSAVARTALRMEWQKDKLNILEKIDSVTKRIDERTNQLDRKIEKNSDDISVLRTKKADWDTKDSWQYIPNSTINNKELK